MTDLLLPPDLGATPIRLLTEADAPAALEALSSAQAAWVRAGEFTGKAGQLALVPGAGGAVAAVLLGVGAAAGPRALRSLPTRLPAGAYRLEGETVVDGAAAALAWAEGGYLFDRYKARKGPARPRLAVAADVDLAAVTAQAHALALCRDMINTPANDMGPLQIETIAREVAEQFGAAIAVTTGDALLEAGYPAVHAVGRAAAPHRAPRVVELSWGPEGAPHLCLVGKGVVFDTGGLDLKPSAGMRLMKKDMGGAAHALALARMVMAAALPVRLTLLLAVVENAVSADAMRPGDVLDTRRGLSVEVGNTDAEGRLILADVLTRAAELQPALTIDMATLTGAARVALGPEVIPAYTADDVLWAELERAAADAADPLWRLPLHATYAPALDSEVADLKNDGDAWAQAGSVIAALFLQRFAPDAAKGEGSWLHLDIFAWNPRGRPGAPVGAEAQAIRALFLLLQRRYA